MEEDFVKESDDKNKIYLSDTRYQNVSIPLEYFTLENAVTEKQFVELTPQEAHGDCIAFLFRMGGLIDTVSCPCVVDN